MTFKKSPICLTLVFCIVSLLVTSIKAQIRPVYDQGALGLAQKLRRLSTNASALMIGAHPDDEDTALLAYLSRGEHARTAYLSLTRGDGGQNILGPELGEALGVIRTEELLQARKLDGAEQYFTRAYDYGFSKTLAEAKQKWDEQIILCDVVKVIREFRPIVVIAQFGGTPADGHGQHQFAGYISPIAIKAAADGGQCRDAGPTWSVSKFYVRHRGQGEPSLRINTGKYDPALGRSYFEIAMHARSQHRSQEQGVLELRGDQFSNITLLSGREGAPMQESSIFDGLTVFRGTANEGFQRYVPYRPELLVESLMKARSQLKDSSADPIALDAAMMAAGIRVDVLADRETVAPGESLPISVRLFSNFPEVKLIDVSFNYPAVKSPEPQSTGQGFFRRETANFSEHFTLSIPKDALISQPYWLAKGRRGNMFAVQAGEVTLPFQSRESVFANVRLELSGQQIQLRKPVEYRFADDIRGEIRRELNIVPKITVTPDKNLVIVPTRARQRKHELSVSLTNNMAGPASGKLRLALPTGWTVSPAEADFAMTRKGENASVRFMINIPSGADAGSFDITAEAVAGDERFSQSMQTIAYEHIQTHRIYRPASITVKLIDVQTAPVKVGYIRGSGDRIPDAVRELGLDVQEISEKDLASSDLSGLDTIIVGIRAYQVRPDLVSNNKRLLDFARNGGTLIVQYQLPQTYSQQNLTPFPAQLGPRVTDENAPVTIADPEHPLFNFPNKIGHDDFTGWVQERNLYNFATVVPPYKGLLESHDAGETENRGGLVIADLGKGKFVYCSYSLFRQLPAGVPGAYRLLANLVSLPKAK